MSVFRNKKAPLNIIYKACQGSIATLELLPDSITNEERKNVVDSNFAEFITDKVKVLSLINPETREKLEEDRSIYDPEFVYQVGEIIETEHNFDIIICSNPNNLAYMGRGVHYFKTYAAALSWYYEHHQKINGKHIRYNKNGQKQSEWNYKNGKRDGKQYSWYENGQKSFESNYKNGKQDGKDVMWYENGQKLFEDNWKDGQSEGKQYGWHENGQKWSEYNYKNGKRDGKQYYWHKNGQKQLEENYKNGQKDGKQKYWYENGEKAEGDLLETMVVGEEDMDEALHVICD